MGMIGQQIKQYRIKKGYTQEALGKLIGVTTQAVSKWERGSSPDAELLPRIADTLGVSIDALFGREEQDLQLILNKKLSMMPGEEAFRYSFELCWSFILGLTGDAHFSEDFIDTFVSRSGVKREQAPDYFAKLVRDDGIATARLSEDFDHFFLMREPRGEGIAAHFEDPEKIRKVFALFADKNLLKTIWYLYSMPMMPLTAALIAKSTGLDLRTVERCMKTLCDHQLAVHTKIATVDGEIDSFAVKKDGCAVPLLCFADEIAKGCPSPVFRMFDRNKPYLSTNG